MGSEKSSHLAQHSKSMEVPANSKFPTQQTLRTALHMKPLKKLCMVAIERRFDEIASLLSLPGEVVQMLLNFMMRKRKASSRTLNEQNAHKFLEHPGLCTHSCVRFATDCD